VYVAILFEPIPLSDTATNVSMPLLSPNASAAQSLWAIQPVDAHDKSWAWTGADTIAKTAAAANPAAGIDRIIATDALDVICLHLLASHIGCGASIYGDCFLCGRSGRVFLLAAKQRLLPCYVHV